MPKPIRPKGDKLLWSYYWHFNKTFWDGKLPIPMVLLFGSTGKESHDGIQQFMQSGCVRIVINQGLKKFPDMAAVALLHEMIHVAMGPDYQGDHGMRFQAEKYRLFMAGAYDNIL